MTCEDCGSTYVTSKCEKGSMLCPVCAAIHLQRGHRVHNLTTAEMP